MKLSLNVRIILAAIVFMIIAQIIHTLSTILTMDYYYNPAYFLIWSKIMMSIEGPPPAEFYYYSLAFAFITGLIYSFIYSRIRVFFKQKSALRKGLKYGFALFLIAGIPSFFTMFLLINLPFELLISWLIFDSLIAYLIGGMAIAKIVK